MFTLGSIIGFAIAYAIIAALVCIMNKTEASMDAKIAVIQENERKREQAERLARRKGGATPSTAAGSADATLMAAAVAAVQMHRKN